jgi:hypothetical protein
MLLLVQAMPSRSGKMCTTAASSTVCMGLLALLAPPAIKVAELRRCDCFVAHACDTSRFLCKLLMSLNEDVMVGIHCLLLNSCDYMRFTIINTT